MRQITTKMMPMKRAPTAQPNPMMRPLWFLGVGAGVGGLGKTLDPVVRRDELSRLLFNVLTAW